MIKLTTWKRKFLNKSGRLVLIKAFLASIPIYFLSVFKIPMGMANSIERLQRNFLWGDSLGNKKLHLVRWDSMRKGEVFGGLGIDHIIDKNNSLLAKWIWRFGIEKDSI
ncbi:hypothetical protein Ddye_021560 [Dipteronia dyeriana]|uniref:Uncharacterized protein n=1 Tax=Dipteronia dyeriana TaxID=168575 RepID=A0AAD9WY44_9ROSI|nr:hypothetical protein Ddye_021560 [Dipteronia dyeriana]